MGGGSYNGKNFGGMHTGADKKQNGGPYSNNGYINDPNSSHLNFLPDEEVIYIGSTNKNKHKKDVPNGTRGTVVDKNNLNNPKQKSSRSLILVDFGLHGVRYVHKNVLQFTSDYSDCLETLCEKQGTTEGDQSSRNKVRSDKRSKFRDAKYQQTLENREKRKQFREWRKDFLDQKESELRVELEDLKQDPTLVENRKQEVVIKQEHRVLKMANDKDETLSEETKQENKARMDELKAQLTVFSNYEKSNMKERDIIREILRNMQSRKFLRNVYNRESYNNYLHSQMNGQEYVFQKETKEYKVNPDAEATSTPERELLRWGLYPHQVVF